MRGATLLTVDAAINLVLGILLVWFPTRVVAALGLPTADSAFYPSILGAVLFGIGIALLLERFRGSREALGLGLAGAVCINLCGGLVLGAWLIAGGLALPARGYLFLWGLVLVLVVLSGIELAAQMARARGPGRTAER